ncbi:ATP-binding protein [Actinosynnema sp.]|uniref:ATP-binding protein n=1 Tax=Actinosynnema sp. TaxID=1872144 RepID=UPI003F83FB40
MNTTGVADLRISGGLLLPHLVRERVAAALPGVERDRLLDLLMVVNALVENALEHAEGPRELRLCRWPVRVEVDDASPQLLPVLGRPGRRHRGLLLVNRLASRWGVLPSTGVKTVWAEAGWSLPQPPPALARPQDAHPPEGRGPNGSGPNESSPNGLDPRDLSAEGLHLD